MFKNVIIYHMNFFLSLRVFGQLASSLLLKIVNNKYDENSPKLLMIKIIKLHLKNSDN